jgi:hypothetical protein
VVYEGYKFLPAARKHTIASPKVFTRQSLLSPKVFNPRRGALYTRELRSRHRRSPLGPPVPQTCGDRPTRGSSGSIAPALRAEWRTLVSGTAVPSGKRGQMLDLRKQGSSTAERCVETPLPGAPAELDHLRCVPHGSEAPVRPSVKRLRLCSAVGAVSW